MRRDFGTRRAVMPSSDKKGRRCFVDVGAKSRDARALFADRDARKRHAVRSAAYDSFDETRFGAFGSTRLFFAFCFK